MREWYLAPVYLARAFGEAPAFKWFVAAALAVSEYVFGTDVLRNCAIGAAGLMVLDTITGLVAAWSRGEGFESGKFSHVLVKVVSYGSAILVAATVPRSIPGLSFLHEACMTAVMGAIVCTEALSIIENIDKMGFKSLGFLARFLRGRLKEIERTKFDAEEEQQ